jgi:hypothetical protein
VGFEQLSAAVMAVALLLLLTVLLMIERTRLILVAIVRSPLTTSYVYPADIGWTSVDMPRKGDDELPDGDSDEVPAGAVDLMMALRESVERAKRERGTPGVPKQRTRDEAPDQVFAIPRPRYSDEDYDFALAQIEQIERRTRWNRRRSARGKA